MKKSEFYAVGKAIKTLRLKSDKTLKESALQCGKTTAWLSNIEQGIRRLTFDDAVILVDFYGYDLNYLSQLVKTFE